MKTAASPVGGDLLSITHPWVVIGSPAENVTSAAVTVLPVMTTGKVSVRTGLTSRNPLCVATAMPPSACRKAITGFGL